MKESISKAVEDTLAPQLFYAVISTGLVTWAVLAANPEPVFTRSAAIVSALLLIYLGMAFSEATTPRGIHALSRGPPTRTPITATS